MSSPQEPRLPHWLTPILLSLIGLICFFLAVVSLPDWFGMSGHESPGVLPAFRTPVAVAIVCLSFPLLQILSIYGLNGLYKLERSDDALGAGIRFTHTGKLLLLYPIMIGLQLLYVALLFPTVLDWLPILIIALGTSILRSTSRFWI